MMNIHIIKTTVSRYIVETWEAINIYTQLHQNTPLITATCIWYSQSTVYSKITANFVLAHPYFGLWDYVPPLPNHAICIFYVEYTYYLYTGKIFCLGKVGAGEGGSGGRGTHLYKTFPLSYMLIVRTKHQEQTYDQVHFLEFRKYGFMAKGRIL